MNQEFKEYMEKGGRAAVEGRLDEAVVAFRQARRIDGTSADACRNLAAVLHMSNQLDEASQMWRAVLEMEPGSGTSHYNLGLILMAKQNFDAAKENFAEALRVKPNMVDAAFNLGRITYQQGDRAAAQEFFEKTIAIQPDHGKAHAILIQVLTEQGFETEAIDAGLRGVRALQGGSVSKPQGYVELLMQIANAYRRLGQLENAAAWYRKAVDADSSNSIAKHLLASVEGNLTEEYAKDYTIKSFDTFARSFDEHLLKILNYQSPDTLASGLADIRPNADAFPTALDLGCGTGLMAASLKLHFNISRFVGVDLSGNMLDVAKDKNLYWKLIQGDLVSVMSSSTEAFHLIVSADVFIYVGDVSAVFVQVARLLKPSGVFAFSIEVSTENDVELAPTGRYRHGKSYVRRLAVENGMTLVRETEGLIRKDARDDIVGCYFYLEKK